MREYWANVYPHVDAHERTGGKFPNPSECDHFRGGYAAFRIHVRLKPEGAPKRYASEANRRAWSVCPEDAAYWQDRGKTLCIDHGGPWYVY